MYNNNKFIKDTPVVLVALFRFCFKKKRLKNAKFWGFFPLRTPLLPTFILFSLKFSKQIVSKIQSSWLLLIFQKHEFREVKKNN